MTPRARRRGRPGGRAALVLLVFIAAALLVFSSAWVSPGARWVGPAGDPALFVWYLGWQKFVLFHGHLRGFLLSNYLQYPHGFNLMWNSSIILPALLLAPVTALLGPLFTYNLLLTLSVAGSGWMAYLALRRYAAQAPAVLGGLLYGFSPYMMAQSLGHAHVVLVIFPPLALLLMDEILVRRRRPAWLAGGALGAAAAAQLITGEEILATTVGAAALGVVLLAVLHPGEVRGRLRHAGIALAAALLVGGALAALPLRTQFAGPQRVSGVLQAGDVYVTDLAAIVVPGPMQALSTDATRAVTSGFTGNVAENNAYLGVPLLLLALWITVRGWRDPVVRWAALFSVTMIVLSLGPHLHFAGRVLGLPLPWLALGGLPLVPDILPARLMLFTFLGLGLMLARAPWARRGDDGAGVAQSGRPRRSLMALAAPLALVPLLPSLPYPVSVVSTPAAFTSGNELSGARVVLVTPFTVADSPMVWQASAGMPFRMPEGRVFVPGPYLGSAPSPIVDELAFIEHNQAPLEMTDSHRAALLADLRRMEVDTVVVGPSPQRERIASLFADLFGAATTSGDGVLVWRRIQAAAADGVDGFSLAAARSRAPTRRRAVRRPRF